MIKTLLLLVVVIVAGVLGYAAMQPNDFRVERKITIAAPPEKIFAILSDFNQWKAWSPWENKDPAMKRTISGAPNGKGAVYEWSGNKDVGSGKMEIIDATAPTKVSIKLDFMSPFEAHNTTDFTLAANGTSTDVTWAMYGPMPYMAKVMGLFYSMDKMVGGDFDTGLANLKKLGETP